MISLELSTKARIRRFTAQAIWRFRVLHWIACYGGQFVGAPVTHSLYEAAQEFVADGREAARALLPGSEVFASEFTAVRADIASRLEDGRSFPSEFDVGPGTSEWLYCIVRSLRPMVVVEVGVAEGYSTAVILAALDANDRGRLVSTDIVAGVGALVRAHPRWELRILEARSPAKQLVALLTDLGEIDLFFHDGDHHYLGQSDDFLAGVRHLRPGGVFISDDVDFSWAFLELCQRLDVAPVVLGEGRKEAGGLVNTWTTETSRMVAPHNRPRRRS